MRWTPLPSRERRGDCHPLRLHGYLSSFCTAEIFAQTLKRHSGHRSVRGMRTMWKGVEDPLPAIEAPSVGSLPCFMSAPTKVCCPLHNPPLCDVNIECACCCRPPSRGMATNSAGSDGAHATGRNNGKGLRHFSMKVCEKVESKGRTTYNEVADELVGEFSGAPHNPPPLSLHTAVLRCAALLCSCHPCATIRAGEQCRIAVHVRCGVTVWHIFTPSMGLTLLCCAVLWAPLC